MYKLVKITTPDTPYLRRNNGIIERVTPDGKSEPFYDDVHDSEIIGNILLIMKQNGGFIRSNDENVPMGYWLREHSFDEDVYNHLNTRYGDTFEHDHCGITYSFPLEGELACNIIIRSKRFTVAIDCAQYFSFSPTTGMVMTLDYVKRKAKSYHELVVYHITKKGMQVVLIERIEGQTEDDRFLLNAKDMTITKYNSEERWKVVPKLRTLLDLCKTMPLDRMPQSITDEVEDTESSEDEESEEDDEEEEN
jgi:hypothetical protein